MATRREHLIQMKTAKAWSSDTNPMQVQQAGTPGFSKEYLGPEMHLDKSQKPTASDNVTLLLHLQR